LCHGHEERTTKLSVCHPNRITLLFDSNRVSESGGIDMKHSAAGVVAMPGRGWRIRRGGIVSQRSRHRRSALIAVFAVVLVVAAWPATGLASSTSDSASRTTAADAVALAAPVAASRTLDWMQSYGKCSQIGWSGSGGSLNAGAHVWTKICRSDFTFFFVLADCSAIGGLAGGPVGTVVSAVLCTPIADWAVNNIGLARGVWIEIYYGRIAGCTFHQRSCSWNAGTW
jgi:hypothetical protein